MSLLTAVRSAVKVADKVTKPVQSLVMYQKYTGQDGYGEKAYAAAVELRAVVDWEARQLRTASGVLTVSRAVITFLDINALASATGAPLSFGLGSGATINGIGDEDILILPDGTTGPVLDIRGFIDPGTGAPVVTEVLLG